MDADFAHTVLSQAQAGIWVLDPAGVTVYANPRLEQLLRAPPQSMRGTRFRDWLPEADRPADPLGGEPPAQDWTLVCADGQAITARLHTRPCALPDGRTGVLAVLEDVSALRRSQAAARDHQERLHRTLALGNMAMWEWKKGAVQWSGALEAIFGIASADFPTSDGAYFALVHPEDREQLATTYWRLLSGRRDQRDVRFHYRIVRPDGGVRWVEATGEVSADAAGRPEHGFGTVLDITDRKELERAVVAAQRQDASLKVATVATHEINNMLTAILFAAQPDLDAPLSDSAKIILEAAERAAQLSRSLLDSARTPRREPLGSDVSALVAERARVLRGLCAGATLRLATDDDIAVSMGRGALSQIIVNLLLNATNAVGKDGEIVLQVRGVRLDEGRHGLPPGDWALIEVQDNGCGMPDAVRDRIFEPFFTTRAEGTGMGLAASRALVTDAGGTITVETAAGEGTTMQVWLPRRAPDVPHPLAADTLPAISGRTCRLLLVEDTALIRDVVAQRLGELGYTVVTARDGLDAMARLQDGMVDVIVTDLDMPRMDGLELQETVHLRHPQLPVIITSSQQRAALKLSQKPQVRFLGKPFDVRQLDATIQALLP